MRGGRMSSPPEAQADQVPSLSSLLEGEPPITTSLGDADGDRVPGRLETFNPS